jgi:predicted MFS family arabinose efflux permease
VLAVSAARGVGFGLVTVAASAIVAELVPPEQLGRASARYGLAVGLPQFVLLSAGVAAAEHLGFTPVFVVAGVLPLLGALTAAGIRVPRRADRPGQVVVPRSRPPAWWPVLAMLGCATAQGGLITFLPLSSAAGTVALALLGTAAGALAGRLVAGELVDRRGWGGRLLRPGVLVTAVGMTVEALVGAGPLVVVGAVVVGVGFGLVQNDALTALFAAAGPQRYGSASAAWNIAYDAGTGVGAVGLGAVADPLGYAAAFGTSAALLGLVALGRRPRSP